MYYVLPTMPETEQILKLDSVVRSHTTKLGKLGLIESRVLAKIIGKKVIEIKYIE